MPDDEAYAVDVAIVASAAADELVFHAQPEVRTGATAGPTPPPRQAPPQPEVRIRFPGSGERDSGQTTSRRNVDSPVEPGKTYRRVFAATRIYSRLLDENG